MRLDAQQVFNHMTKENKAEARTQPETEPAAETHGERWRKAHRWREA